MRRSLLITVVLFLSAFVLRAQGDLATCPHEQFRQRMNNFVKEGKKAYDKGDRTGLIRTSNVIYNAVELRKRAGNLQDNDYLEYMADAYRLAGDYYYEEGAYDESYYTYADTNYQNALSIYLWPSSPFKNDLDKIPVIRRALAQLYYKQGRYSEALDQISQAAEFYTKAFANGKIEKGDDNFKEFQDIRMQRALCLARTGSVDEALIQVENTMRYIPSGTEYWYETLRKKAKIMILSGKPEYRAKAAELYKRFFNWKRKDALKAMNSLDTTGRQDYWMRFRPFVADCYQIEDEDPDLLYEVALFSKGLLIEAGKRQGDKALSVSTKDIRKRLSANACVIEFINYQKPDNSSCMAALVLEKKKPVKWLPVLSSDDFYGHRFSGGKDYQTIMSQIPDVFYTDYYYEVGEMYTDSSFCRSIWTPELCKTVAPYDKVYIVPDGYLHQYSLEYVFPEKEYGNKAIYRLSSSRTLLSDRKISLDSLLVMGDLTYTDSTYYLYESKTIDSLMRIRSNPHDLLLRGADATADTLRTLLGKYSGVLLSTHGNYFEQPEWQGSDLRPCFDDSSLDMSLILLSGEERFSARDLRGLDLSGVDLVILSSCKSGQGYVTADGVYGFQRAFKSAGAGGLMVGLWLLDNKFSQNLAITFFTNLKEGLTVRQALVKARESYLESIKNWLVYINSFTREFEDKQWEKSSDVVLSPVIYGICNAFVLIDVLD